MSTTSNPSAYDNLDDLSQLRAMLVGRNDTIEFQSRRLAEQDAALAERDRRLAELEERAAQNDYAALRADRLASEAEELKSLLGEHVARLAELKSTHASLERAHAALEASLQDERDFKLGLTSGIDGLRIRIEALAEAFEAADARARSAIADSAAREDLLREREQVRESERQNALARARLAEISPNFRHFEEKRPGLGTEVATLVEACETMRGEVDRAPELYRPSKFWEDFYRTNMEQLAGAGLSNIKLTANQNYQNFIPRSLRDPKLRPMLRWFRQNRSPRALFSYIANPDKASLEGHLAQPTSQIFGDDPASMALYRAMVTLEWEFALANDPLGLCDRLVEPELGNPIRILHRGKLISQDLATSAIEINAMLPPLYEAIGAGEISVLELGAGYGRLAHAILNTQRVKRYVIVDIPPALYASQWYISTLFPDLKVFTFRPFDSWDAVREEAEAADVLCLLPHQIEQLPDGFVDIALTVSSLHEMLPQQADNYLQQMARVSRHMIASKQYWVYNNPYDELVLRQEDYAWPAGFERIVLKNDPLNPVFFVEVRHRTGNVGET
ncbi:putative sugar O-methyltransferase [Aurantimonas sp. MSK8Z-1]|uniref:putative sugar O-methyltransferase n=1 Tax=Mangrovibrevibacter kandeliae TaxID=2968473 RepID=UPI002117932B|nr:putative sugar O-methyltransferase [Aurantimonas sp. MSK8Z-1]MCW4117008.1 putative sugar O-methyltransferase [Aurantimonas sp. MSK8Z-1]